MNDYRDAELREIQRLEASLSENYDTIKSLENDVQKRRRAEEKLQTQLNARHRDVEKLQTNLEDAAEDIERLKTRIKVLGEQRITERDIVKAVIEHLQARHVSETNMVKLLIELKGGCASKERLDLEGTIHGWLVALETRLSSKLEETAKEIAVDAVILRNKSQNPPKFRRGHISPTGEVLRPLTTTMSSNHRSLGTELFSKYGSDALQDGALWRGGAQQGVSGLLNSPADSSRLEHQQSIESSSTHHLGASGATSTSISSAGTAPEAQPFVTSPMPPSASGIPLRSLKSAQSPRIPSSPVLSAVMRSSDSPADNTATEAQRALDGASGASDSGSESAVTAPERTSRSDTPRLHREDSIPSPPQRQIGTAEQTNVTLPGAFHLSALSPDGVTLLRDPVPLLLFMCFCIPFVTYLLSVL